MDNKKQEVLELTLKLNLKVREYKQLEKNMKKIKIH